MGRSLALGRPDVYPYARSPDGIRLALTTYKSSLIRIVDLEQMQVVRELRLGAGGEARTLSWVADDRLIAIVQRLSEPTRRYVRERTAVTLDPGTGDIVARRRLTNKLAIAGADSGGGRLVVLFRSSLGKGSTVELAVIETNGSVRARSIEVGRRRGGALNRPTLTVDPTGRRAFLLVPPTKPGAPPALEVDLETFAVSRHRLRVERDRELASAAIFGGVYADAVSERSLLAAGAVAADERIDGTLVPAAGVFLIDTDDWTARLLDQEATYFRSRGDRVITYGPASRREGAYRGTGVSVYELSGRRLSHLYANRTFSRLELAGGYGHLPLAPPRTKRLVFDTQTGRALGMLPALRHRTEVLEPPPPPVVARAPGIANELRAFERAKRPADVVPRNLLRHLQITDSRRIAEYVDRRDRRSTLYVAKTLNGWLCHVLAKGNGGGSGCSPRHAFFHPGKHISASSGRLFAGVVANEVARVVIVGSRRVRHPVDVTADGGFIYDCRAYNGCAGLIACVEAYSEDGRFLSGQSWLKGGCRRR